MIESAIAIFISFPPCFPRGGETVGLVLVFAATRREMPKLSIYMLKSQKARMDYSRHDLYTCNHVEFTLFSLLS